MSVAGASVSIPGAVSPVMIDVQVAGKHYQEMHVDGGVITQLYADPPRAVAELERATGKPWTRPIHVYVIRNGRLDPEWVDTPRRTLAIGTRAIDSLVQAEGVGDVLRTYLIAKQNKADFNLAYIGSDFSAVKHGVFDSVYMNSLFDYGGEASQRVMGLRGERTRPWPSTDIRDKIFTRFPLRKGTPLRTPPRPDGRLRRPLLLLLPFIACGGGARAQTPSPLQEWQYSGGIILARLFEPELPRWRTVLGIAGEVQPAYSGASAYRLIGGPDVLIYYRDVAFISTGEGLGYNFLRGKHYQFGLGMTYDLGRKEKDDLTNLHGMGDISAAPVAKIYGSVVLSKKFPLILRVDARQFIGGAGGAVGDAAVYLPLPGSSERFVMFAGPSITLADHHYLQSLYGVSAQQSLASGHPEFLITHDGTAAAGVGFSATKFLGEHWLINLDAAISQLRGDPAHSPIVEQRTQRAIALSFGYHHETSNPQ